MKKNRWQLALGLVLLLTGLTGFVAMAQRSTATQIQYEPSTGLMHLMANAVDYVAPQNIASGAQALNTASITTATCDGGLAVTATGTLSTDRVSWSFNAAPTATNKYGAFLVVYAVPSANTVTFFTCNPSATTSTPTAMTVNWTVERP